LRVDGEEREDGHDAVDEGPVGEVVLEVAEDRVPQVLRVICKLLFRREKRVVDRELHDRAGGARLPGESTVRERLGDERDRRRASDAKEREDSLAHAKPRRDRGEGAEAGDRRRGFGTRDDEEESGDAEPPRGARRARIFEMEIRGEGERPDTEEERDLHAAPQRPVERAEREEHRWDQERRDARRSLRQRTNDEAARDPERAEGARHCDDRGPLHQERVAKAEEPAEREHERIEQARVAGRVSVAREPLEGVTFGGSARVIEMDEDVVEGRAPLAARLHHHVAVELARGRERAERSPDQIEGAFVPKKELA